MNIRTKAKIYIVELVKKEMFPYRNFFMTVVIILLFSIFRALYALHNK